WHQRGTAHCLDGAGKRRSIHPAWMEHRNRAGSRSTTGLGLPGNRSGGISDRFAVHRRDHAGWLAFGWRWDVAYSRAARPGHAVESGRARKIHGRRAAGVAAGGDALPLLSSALPERSVTINSLDMKPRKQLSLSRAATEFRYEKLTWPEIDDAVALGKVCLVPCGAVEQHGAHLPLDVDIVCPTEIARGAGSQVPDKMLVLPTVCYGYTGHVMDFPGTINHHYHHFIDHVL